MTYGQYHMVYRCAAGVPERERQRQRQIETENKRGMVHKNYLKPVLKKRLFDDTC